MSRDPFRRRLSGHVRRLTPLLLLLAAVAALAEGIAAMILYGPVLRALGIAPWRVGARLAGSGMLLALLPMAAGLILLSVLDGRLHRVAAAAAAGGSVGVATTATMALVAIGIIFPAGLPGDASSRRALIAVFSGTVAGGVLGAAGFGWLASRRRTATRRARLALVLPAACLALALVPLGTPPPPPVTQGTGRVLETAPLPGRSVLLVTVDTLRASHMSLYGYARDTTPLLGRWAAEQVVFEHAVTPKAYTAPALASALSGMVPQVNGVQRHPGRIPEAIRTLAEMFADAGYHTAAFVTNPAITDRAFRFDQGFVEWHTYNNERSRADIVLPDVVSWLQEPVDGPFFMWIHLRDPHSPYRPPSPWKEKFVGDAWYGDSRDVPMALVDGRTGPFQVSPRDALGPDWRDLDLEPRALSSPDYLISQYDGEIAFTDAQLAPFLERFRTADPDAVVVITADHGESLGEHGYMFAHGRHAYEPTSWIPMLFSHPDFAPGRVRGLVSLLDLAPTLADLADLDPDPYLQGSSLGPVLFENGAHRTATGGERTLRLEARNTASYPTLALRTPSEKLVLVPRRTTTPLDIAATFQLGLGGSLPRLPPLALRVYRTELYDLASDPEERVDLAELRPEEVRDLSGVLWRHVRADTLRRELVGVATQRLQALDPATAEELRALGYLQ